MSCSARRWLRGAALLAAAAVLRGDSCGGNLGENEPRAVTFRLSVGTGTLEANGESGPPSVSADGRYVVFSSRAQNLASGSTGFEEIYFRDRFSDVVTNVSRIGDLRDPKANRADCFNPAVSADGRFVVFQTATEFDGDNPNETAGQTNLFVRDMITGALRRVGYSSTSATQWPDAALENPSISADGRYVAFKSKATNLGSWTANGSYQVYVADLSAFPPTYTLVSHEADAPFRPADSDAEDPHLSANGQVVVFASRASNLVSGVSFISHIFVGTAPWTGNLALVSRETGAAGPAFDADSGVPFVNSDATHVAFTSIAANLGGSGPAVFVRELSSPHTTRRVAESPFAFERPVGPTVFLSNADRVGLTADGRFLAYTRMVPNADDPFGPPEDLQIRVQDLLSATEGVVSIGPLGGPGNGYSVAPAISADGRWAAFLSIADDLVVGDRNGTVDVFGHGPLR